MDIGPGAIGLGAFSILVAAAIALVILTDANEWEFLAARILFVLAALVAAAVTVYWLCSEDHLTAPNLIVGALIGAAAIVLLVGALKWTDYREDRTLTKLLPGNKPMPTMPVGCEAPLDAIAVFFGSNVSWSTGSSFTPLRMGGVEMIAVEKEQQKQGLLITVLRVFDDQGNIIARIDPDGFWTAPSVFKKKLNRSTLIVNDRKDEEVLKIEFINQRAIKIEGVFRDQRGVVVRITPDKLVLPRNNTYMSSCIGNFKTGIQIN